MKDSLALHLTEPFRPLDLPPQATGFALVVLRTKRIRIQRQESIVDLDAEAVGRLAVGKVLGRMRHPTQRDVKEAGFVFRIATADIGVVSGEPHLLQPIRMLEMSRKGCPAHSVRERAFVGT